MTSYNDLTMDTDNEHLDNIKSRLGIEDQEALIHYAYDEASYTYIANMRTILHQVSDDILGDHPNPYYVLEGVTHGVSVYFAKDIYDNKDLYTRVKQAIGNMKLQADIYKVLDWNDLRDVLIDAFMPLPIYDMMCSLDKKAMRKINRSDDLGKKVEYLEVRLNKNILFKYLDDLHSSSGYLDIMKMLECSTEDTWANESVGKWVKSN